MKKIFRKEMLIGLIVLIAMAILFFGIDFLKGVNVFKAANYYVATYDNVEGLAVSAPGSGMSSEPLLYQSTAIKSDSSVKSTMSSIIPDTSKSR